MRRIVFEANAFEDFANWALLDKKVLVKIVALLRNIQRNPFGGLGKPEPLRHELQGYWSRRITDEHRLVNPVRACVHWRRYTMSSPGWTIQKHRFVSHRSRRGEELVSVFTTSFPTRQELTIFEFLQQSGQRIRRREVVRGVEEEQAYRVDGGHPSIDLLLQRGKLVGGSDLHRAAAV